MKVEYQLALVLLTGAAFGAAATQALHAQAKPPVYAITDISETTDPEAANANRGRSDAAATEELKEFGGRYLVRTEKITVVDGTPPQRFNIIVFDNAEKAAAWLKSPSHDRVTAIRFKTTKSRQFIVDGLPQ